MPRQGRAVEILNRGASLVEIGNVLRHRSRMTATVQARYDIDGLRSVARNWPVPEAVQCSRSRTACNRISSVDAAAVMT